MKYGKNIHIIGFAGTEGAALLEYLNQKFPKAKLTAHNFCPRENFIKHFRNAHTALEKQDALEKGKAILELDNVEYRFKDEYLDGIEDADTIFVPQSWYLYDENKELGKFSEKFRSITRLYFDLFPGKIIGITGSNGKTTTANFIAEIMKRAYPSTLFSGNDRRAEQVLEKIAIGSEESLPRREEADKDDWLVLEISNRQLKIDLGKSPDVSVITNITPNHLTEHDGFDDYAATKASILKYQKADQWSVLNDDDPESQKLIQIDAGETMPFSTEKVLSKGVFVRHGNIVIKHAEKEEVVMSVEDFPLKGAHNLSNALAAVAATYLADVNLEIIAQTLRGMEPIPQRMELVGTVNGVEYYNDSASTVPESTIAAVETLKTSDNNVTLILGGNSKGSDYSDLGELIQEKKLNVVFLRSPVAEEIKGILKFEKTPSEVETLKDAVNISAKKSQPGDAVLFSPAAEYFVYFKDKMPGYKNFRHMVESLTSPPQVP